MYRVAIVDDNETWCFVLAHLLQQQQYKVSTFTDPHAFCSEAERFDLALIDFSMPSPRYQAELDGPELIRILRKRLAHPPLLVLISAFFTKDLLEAAPDLCPEADACFGKSLGVTELLDKVQQLLVRKKPLSTASHLTGHPSQQFTNSMM